MDYCTSGLYNSVVRLDRSDGRLCLTQICLYLCGFDPDTLSMLRGHGGRVHFCFEETCPSRE